MAKSKMEASMNSTRKMRPASTPEARQAQLISMAYDVAEKQLREGTASSQVISHFLKMGSTREQIELEKLKKENAVLEAKAEAYKSAENMESLYKQAIDAMMSYSGQTTGDDSESDGDDYE